jgi:protein-tyrosine kinase
MNRLLSALRTMHDTGKWTPLLDPEAPEHVLDDPALTKLNGKATEPVLDTLALPDSGDQGLGRAQVRRQQSRPENLTAINRHPQIDARAVAFHQADTVAAEQYRKLFIELVQARRLRQLQTLLITSAVAGEGKSISALNLAITSATNGDQQGALLIDTDFRKPNIHKYLGIHPEWGLADYLLGEVEYSQIFCKTQIPGLTIIPAGRKVSNPTALLASTRMEEFLRDTKAHKQYSHIILDSSPVLLTSESKGLLQHVDTAILVVRAKKTPAEVVSQAIKILGEENILGCVFNGITATDFSHYHYYYSQEYYRTYDTSS